jgi:DNA-binding response OmpR family regulator
VTIAPITTTSRPVTVLVVDDERPLVQLITSYLEREGFRVLQAFDGATALEIARAEAPDLLVLDLMLPGIDGLEVCRRLRAFSDAYVIMLTARTEEIDRIVGLTTGADDYVTKPFSPRELVARVRVMLRRPRAMSASPDNDTPAPLCLGRLMVDRAAREVHFDGEPVPLTRIEYDLLAALAEHPGLVLTRAQLIDRVWGEFFGDEHVVDVHLSNLRRKLRPDPSGPLLIETVRGVGYRFHRPES